MPPTRIYLPDYGSYTNNAPISPAFDAAWLDTTTAKRQTCFRAKQGTAFNIFAWSSNASTRLGRQYVSEPLLAQTIAGTVKGQARTKENSTAYDVCPAAIIRVCSGDGSTFRGTLASYMPAAIENEFAASYTNNYYPPAMAMTPVTCQEGDRLVIEIGTKMFNGYYAMSGIDFGDDSPDDLPVDNTTTDQYCPWIEFSNRVYFEGDSVFPRILPLPPAERFTQSQSGKRIIPRYY